jgi:integrase
MPAEKRTTQHPYRRLPSHTDVAKMAQPNTSMRPALARTTAFAGLRAAEHCTLTWDDVDFDADAIRVGLRMRGKSHRVVRIPPYA